MYERNCRVLVGTIVKEVTFSVYRDGERKIINTDKYKADSFAGNKMIRHNNRVEVELKTMSIRASVLGKTPGIQATVKSGGKKMREFGDAAAEREADTV